MFCPRRNCKFTYYPLGMAADIKFCPRHGMKLHQVDCPHCSHKDLSPIDTFCTECGRSVEEFVKEAVEHANRSNTFADAVAV